MSVAFYVVLMRKVVKSGEKLYIWRSYSKDYFENPKNRLRIDARFLVIKVFKADNAEHNAKKSVEILNVD